MEGFCSLLIAELLSGGVANLNDRITVAGTL
jgi:hypothetical protein